ncbi:unnamed protein product, partial [Rotaria magnacalcarata]
MHNYYSTQNKAAVNGFARRTARQHLSAKRTNAPEIICLNEQTTTNKGTLVRTAEQAIDGTNETRSIKRIRVSSEQDLLRSSSMQSTTSVQTG